MYYSSPPAASPISASSHGGELICPGCEMCCDVIYCGQLKFANDYNDYEDIKKERRRKCKYKNERECLPSNKIIEAIRDVQKRALHLQRKLRTMENLNAETTRADKKLSRLSKPQKIDQRSCYCPGNPSEDIRRYTKSWDPIKPRANDRIEESVTVNEKVSKTGEKVQEETQTEKKTVNQRSEKKTWKKSEEVEEDKGTKEATLFGGCAPCGLTCGFRYERDDDYDDDDNFAPSDVSRRQKYRENKIGCSAPRSSRRRLTGARSFPRGKSTQRRTWCCCPCGM